MRLPSGRIGTISLSLLTAPLLAGCLAAPKLASTIVPVAPKPTASPHELAAGAVLPAGYWKQSGDSDIATALRPGRRVVITEFGLEFVDLTDQMPFSRQMMVKPPPIITGPISPMDGVGLGIEAVGLGRKYARMTEVQQQLLAGTLCAAFEEYLRCRGLIVLPREAATASLGYADLKAKPNVKSSPLLLLNPLGDDIGVVMHTRAVSAPGLGIVTQKASKRLPAEARILHDTGTDLGIAVRLRVGVYQKKAALEGGSLLRLTTGERQTTYKAKHSILSDAVVISPTKFQPFVGWVEPILFEEFALESAAMLPKFMDLAFRELPAASSSEVKLVRLPASTEAVAR
jgi:hypothetical protein